MDDQEIDARRSTGGFHWEGAVTVSSGERRVGPEYLELTGYAERLKLSPRASEEGAMAYNSLKGDVMADNITTLTTEHLRLMREDSAAFRAEMRAEFSALTKVVEDGFDDMRKRLSRVEQTMVGLKRDEAEAAAELTEHRHTLDRLDGIIKQLRDRITVLESRAAN